jgi:hypothetical protein
MAATAEMTTVTAGKVGLPAAAKTLGESQWAVRRLLLANPDVDQKVERVWGRRLLGPEDIDAIKELIAKRDAR